MISASGTFDYVAAIPERGVSAPFQARLRHPIALTGDKSADFRLVGHAPVVHISDIGPPLNPGPANPASSRSRISLKAVDAKYALGGETSFVLDRGLISALQPGDVLGLSRTGCGQIGVSALRKGQLIFAVGAITAVSLGKDFQARCPHELIAQAEAVFRGRDPEFAFTEYPLEIRAGDEMRILYEGRMKVGEFEVWILHGFRVGIPGTNESAAVARCGSCSIVDANSSLLFLRAGIECHTPLTAFANKKAAQRTPTAQN